MAQTTRSVELRSESFAGDTLHTFTIAPALGAKALAKLAAPFTHKVPELEFRRATAIYSRWPFDYVVSETNAATVLAVADSSIEYMLEGSPEIIGEKLAWMLGVSLTTVDG